ncbi:hypothetical protein TEA_015367 [Camellia sinensis var. sinensis]|uniref:Uncharacterized protein n=1 Tax=Camellia sinensis var. sinensis TaxID=542762 RepID=A0A4S4D253_CAMSN|nr:hypothetical protein TEA_015367 [Camellia sinensis var. sinensis]
MASFLGVLGPRLKQASLLWLHGFRDACCLHRVFWFYPLYVFSFILSSLWYSDIAKYGFLVIGKYGPSYTEMPIQPELSSSSNATQMDKYKWNFSGLSLDKRLDFFESNWIFFAGFGNPCVLAIFLFSPLVSYGVMSILFPLFVLTATGSDADKLITSQRSQWKGAVIYNYEVQYLEVVQSIREEYNSRNGFNEILWTSVVKEAKSYRIRVLPFFPLKPREQIHDNKAF